MRYTKTHCWNPSGFNDGFSFVNKQVCFSPITVHHRTNKCPKMDTVCFKNARF